jgi:SAM-dependent methyltransferase
LGFSVAKKLLFQNYLYNSSTSPVFIQHMEGLAKVIKGYNPKLVAEIGCNDGILLKPLQENGMRAVGIEPDKNMIQICRNQGFEVIGSWLESDKFAQFFIDKYGKADVVVGCNVFAHIHNIRAVLENAKNMMSDDGVMIIEVAHLLKLVENNYFDTIYHEHFFNWSLISFIELADILGMYIADVEEIPTHGGSLRIFVKKGEDKPTQRVIDVLEKEFEAGLDKAETYINLQKRIDEAKEKLNKIVWAVRYDGKKVIGYGAPAKANTLMTYFGIGKEHLDYIIDDARMKQGLFTPGNHIEIKAMPEKIEADYILILAWNFAESIIEKVKATGYTGGFILPFPEPKIL